MSTPPLTTLELVKMTGPIILFGILLPTVDSLTDLWMIIKLYGGIIGCKYVDPEDYISSTNGTWEDLFTCQQDPDTYCQLNPGIWICDSFYTVGYPEKRFFPNCTWDIDTCAPDPATFCKNNPNRLTCGGHYQHVKFATMFLGNYFGFGKNLTKPFPFQFHLC